MTIARSSSKAALALISAGFLLAAFAVTSAFGTTLLSLSVNSLSEQAEFVFEGEVIAVEAQRSGSRGMVSTFVTFRVIDTLKCRGSRSWYLCSITRKDQKAITSILDENEVRK